MIKQRSHLRNGRGQGLFRLFLIDQYVHLFKNYLFIQNEIIAPELPSFECKNLKIIRKKYSANCNNF